MHSVTPARVPPGAMPQSLHFIKNPMNTSRGLCFALQYYCILLLTVLFRSLLFFLCFVNVIISFFYYVYNFYSVKFKFQSYHPIGKQLLTLFILLFVYWLTSCYDFLSVSRNYFKTLQILIIGLLSSVHNPNLILKF